MDVCVCLLGADGRVVEGSINTLSATTARSARVRVPSLLLLCMSVNVRWNGRGWPGKVHRSPVASPKERNQEIELKKRPTERYRKSRMAKNGNGN
jgi:hypothetical protein